MPMESQMMRWNRCENKLAVITKASRLTLPENFNAGIGNVNAATTDKVEYFNLQGIRIENPTHGLYIRRAGKKVEKVIL